MAELGHHDRAVSRSDGAPASPWPAIDLRQVLATLPVSRSGSGPTASAGAWSVTSAAAAGGAIMVALGGLSSGAPTPRQRRRSKGRGTVPHSAFVCIGRLADPSSNPEAIPLGSVKARGAKSRSASAWSANDNVRALAARKSVWRELFFLTLLVITLAGAFWTGRQQNFQRIIVVPGPSSFYSVVT